MRGGQRDRDRDRDRGGEIKGNTYGDRVYLMLHIPTILLDHLRVKTIVIYRHFDPLWHSLAIAESREARRSEQLALTIGISLISMDHCPHS
jgi:archaellum biogenesis protein FlaJ (TadC family)